jgi:hypothetical protein
MELDAPGIDDADLLDLGLEELRVGAPVAFEGELHVVGRHRLAVVKAGTVAEDEVVDEAVG